MLTIREGHPDDAEALGVAHLAAWRVGYRGVVTDEYLDSTEFAENRMAIWRGWTWNEKGNSALFVSELDGRVVGFGLCGPSREHDGWGEVYSFYLHPDAWGSGAAAAAMDRCEEWLAGQGYPAAVLWVLRDNPRGRRFYEKAGWSATGEETDYETGARWGMPQKLVEVEYHTTLG